MRPDAAIGRVTARAYTVPTDAPEADGTFAWDKTTLVVVEVAAGGETGIGYTYADACPVRLIEKTLGPVIAGANAMDVSGAWTTMQRAVPESRSIRPGGKRYLCNRCLAMGTQGEIARRSPCLAARPGAPICIYLWQRRLHHL
jgi:Mandelate racemase / muconate lactonizing enzyme, N-terminal domain